MGFAYNDTGTLCRNRVANPSQYRLKWKLRIAKSGRKPTVHLFLKRRNLSRKLVRMWRASSPTIGGARRNQPRIGSNPRAKRRTQTRIQKSFLERSRARLTFIFAVRR